MSWKEVSPGRFERPLDDAEKLILVVGPNLANREYLYLNAAARLTVNLPPEEIASALREAWKITRHDYPFIATWRSGDTIVYETPDPVALDAWLSKTFVITTEHATASDLIANLHPDPLATLYYLPHTSEIVLRCAHWRIDGVGLMYCLDRILQALAEPREVQFGNEHVRLSPSLEKAFPASVVTTPETERTAEAQFRELKMNGPSLGLEYLPATVPKGTRRVELGFSEQDTKAILAACKARGFGITAAAHAAMVVATHEFASPSTRGRPHTQIAPMNLRPYLAAPFNTPDRGLAHYTMIPPVTLQPADFTTYVTKLHEFYRRDRTPAKSPVLSAQAGFARRMVAAAALPRPAGQPLPSEPILDSLGILDQRIRPHYGQRVSVENVIFVPELLTPEVFVFLYTFRGQLQLSAAFNEAYYHAEFMQRVLERIKAVLLKELGLQKAAL
ncbi:hypothetical protein M432DRAFT_257711 [Thermoascus aurantiacus ATCC 26904]